MLPAASGQEAFERERRFTDDAAHQLRTPLTVLQGQLDVALRRPRSAENYRHTLEVLRDQVAELRQIVESFFLLARAETEAALADRHPLALDCWLPAYIGRWKDDPRHDDLRLQVDASATVNVSEPLFTQLVNNLLNNALKYSPSGTSVTIQLSRRDDQAELAVCDFGIEVSEADRAASFQPFFRSDQARHGGNGGLGLGLALADRIARAHDGRLACYSDPSRGTRFVVSLPTIAADGSQESGRQPKWPTMP